VVNAAPASGPIARRRSGAGLVIGLAALVGALALLSLGVGPVRLSPGDVVSAIWASPADTARIIVIDIRLPRTLLGLLIGAVLGLSGAAMQGLLRNPLASPSVFGAPQAAAFAAVSMVSLGLADTLSFALPVAAIMGAFLSVFLLLVVAGRNASLLLLILAGLAVASLAGAGTALAMNLAPNPFAALEIAFWLLGSLEDRSLRHVMMAAPFILAGGLLLCWRAGDYRALALGEDAAESLGVDVQALRLLVVCGVALGVGASVAVAGAIGFIGLVAPHLVRPLMGHDATRVLLPSALAGAALLLASDIAVRLIPATTDIKVGVLTALAQDEPEEEGRADERRSLSGSAL
jgi:iron complex transport system permease protein